MLDGNIGVPLLLYVCCLGNLIGMSLQQPGDYCYKPLYVPSHTITLLVTCVYPGSVFIPVTVAFEWLPRPGRGEGFDGCWIGSTAGEFCVPGSVCS